MSPPFDAACALVRTALAGTARQEILSAAETARDMRQALLRLREGMRSHVWKTGGAPIRLDEFVEAYDVRARAEGFHALHDWDGKADRSNTDIIPVDMLQFLIDHRGQGPVDRAGLAILLDYYFFYILALLSLQIWNDGDPNDHLDDLAGALDELQGPQGSGQRFVGDAETLLIISTAHFELNDRCYDILLDRVRALNGPHQLAIAVGHAAALGSHLRFGYEATYAKSYPLMRDDNGVDYRWQCYALATVMRAYDAGEAVPPFTRAILIDALLNGLTADAEVFTTSGSMPALDTQDAERTELRDRLHRHQADLVAAFERLRPVDTTYSPIALLYNFSHNVLKGTVADALLWGEPWNLSVNDLLTGSPPAAPKGEAKQKLARTLMGYARANPDTIRGRRMPAIVYDPALGRRAFATAMRHIQGRA